MRLNELLGEDHEVLGDQANKGLAERAQKEITVNKFKYGLYIGGPNAVLIVSYPFPLAHIPCPTRESCKTARYPHRLTSALTILFLKPQICGTAMQTKNFPF